MFRCNSRPRPERNVCDVLVNDLAAGMFTNEQSSSSSHQRDKQNRYHKFDCDKANHDFVYSAAV